MCKKGSGANVCKRGDWCGMCRREKGVRVWRATSAGSPPGDYLHLQPAPGPPQKMEKILLGGRGLRQPSVLNCP